MFKLVVGDVEADDATRADQIYRFRHGFFVDHLRWEACRKPNGRERDEFDGPDSLHVVGFDHDEIVSYARLLPTTRPHLLTHLYPELLQGGVAPVGPRIFEWTRHSVAPKKREAKGMHAFAEAHLGAVAEAVEVMGLEGLLVQTHPVLVERLMDVGWDVEPLALPKMYDGGLMLPIYARLTSQVLATACSALSATGLSLRAPAAQRRPLSAENAQRLVA